MDSKLPINNFTKVTTSIYMMVMFLAFPLYYQNNYINMLEAKTSFFVPATVIYLIVGVVSILIIYLTSRAQEKKTGIKMSGGETAKDVSGKLLIQDIFFIIFLVAVILATISSGDIQNAWLAPECKMFGTKIILLCCGIYVITSMGYTFNRIVKYVLVIGIGAVLVLTVLNRYGIDPLDMYSNLVEYQKHKYMSTIGNANILSNFICIFTPVFMGLFIYARNLPERIIQGVMVWLTVMAGIATNSDSFFLGLGASVIFSLWFSLTDKKTVVSYLIMLMLCSAAPLGLKVFNELSTFEYKWYNLQRDLINNVPWLIIILLLAFVMLLTVKSNKDIEWKKVRRIVFAIIGLGALALIICIIRVNTGMETTGSKYLTFSDEWGTNRGYVWTRTCQLFADLPFYQQVMGIGPGEFRDFFSSFNIERAMMGLPDFADPHSEVLYYLVATGFVGAIGYFGMIISAIVKCIRVRSNATIILAAIFVAWIAQGLVNNPLVFVTPYVFLFLGISRYEIKKNI